MVAGLSCAILAAGCAAPIVQNDGAVAVSAAEETAVRRIADRPPFTPSVQRAPAVEPVGIPPELPLAPPSGTNPASDRDTWFRIRAGLSLSFQVDAQVMREIAWYRTHPGYLRRTAERSRPYLPYIVREIERRGMPVEFALLPIIESAFQLDAHSAKYALGIWQIMPSTGAFYGLKQNRWYDGRLDIVASTRAALDYLEKLLRHFEGTWQLAAAAYNCGEGTVMRAVARNRAAGKPIDFRSLELPRETRTHMSRLLATIAVVADPVRHGIALTPIIDRVVFRPVVFDGPIDLEIAASLAGITFDEIVRLNPGFKRGTTDPGGPHQLQLPHHAVARFKAELARLPTATRTGWEPYMIVPGDTLGGIAERYRTTVAALKGRNRLASDRIRAGRRLLVPIPMRAPLPGLGTSVYVVRKGDSLWRIARAHGVSMKQLATWNGLSLQPVLQPGQRLTIHRRIAPPSHRAASPLHSGGSSNGIRSSSVGADVRWGGPVSRDSL